IGTSHATSKAIAAEFEPCGPRSFGSKGESLLHMAETSVLEIISTIRALEATAPSPPTYKK
ncbi:unnamed protein product, partial [Chrysoparadoxa australica]